jgi:hypothetical protein
VFDFIGQLLAFFGFFFILHRGYCFHFSFLLDIEYHDMRTLSSGNLKGDPRSFVSPGI